MKKNACFNCGDFNHLAYDCRKRVKQVTSRSQNNTHKSFTPRPVVHKPFRPPMRPMRSNMNGVRPNITSFIKLAHSYTNRPFQRTSAVRSQYKAPWVPTVNRNFPPVNRKFSTVSKKISTVNRKFPTANRKFPTSGTKFHTDDMGKKGKAVKPSTCWFWKPSHNLSNKGPNSNSVSVMFKKYTYIDTQGRFNGCPRHMTGKISYLSDFEPFDGGYVSFGQGGCKITGKGTIKTGKLEFENVYFVKDLKFTWTFLIKTKDETSGILRKFITEIENLKDLKVKIIRCDNGREFRNKVMNDFCSQKGIKREFSNARTLQQNGVAERRNRTLIEAARTMLADAKLSVTFWAEAGSLRQKGMKVTLLDTLYILGVTTNSDEPNGVEADVSHMKTTITASPTPTLRIHKDHPKSQIIGHVDTPIQTKNKSKKNVWTLVDCPKGVRPIKTKWVLKNKKDKRGIVIRNKARLVAQGHTQEEGIDYDEVFAHVARIEAIGLFLDYALFMSFIDPKFLARVYKVEKAMYGLHQALRAWYGTLSKYLLTHGFQRGTIDQTFFIKRLRGDFILIQVYVDDIIFGSSNPHLCREFKALMHEKFQMSAMGDIFKKFRYLDVRSSNTPMHKENHWGKDRTVKDVDLHLYRSMIGSLMYLTASRADIMFAICAYARHQVTPKEYSDYGGATQDHKSTTEGCPFLGRRLSMPCEALSRDISSSILRLRNLKLQDEEGISSLPDTELFENLTLMGYNICPNQKFTFQKDEPASPLRDVSEGEAYPTDSGFEADQDRATIPKTSTLPHDSAPQVTPYAAGEGTQELEMNKLKAKVKLLEDREGVAAKRSGDDAPIKGKNLDEREAVAERVSDDTEEMATVLTSMERFKRNGIRFEQESVKKLKTSKEVPKEAKSPDEVPKEKVKEMMQVVPIEEVYVEAFQVKHHIIDWKNLMHAPVEWKLYDTCGVHHVTAKDKEIFLLVEKDYPLRKGLAIGMISYKLKVENLSRMANDLILKIYKMASTPSQQGD
nr:hypothetical protein [Tanacetum cinerariifolium]